MKPAKSAIHAIQMKPWEREAELEQLRSIASDLAAALDGAGRVLSVYGSGGTQHTDPTTGEPVTPLMRQIEAALQRAKDAGVMP